MALTENQLAEYTRDGYIVLPGLVPHATIDEVLAAGGALRKDGGWTAEALDFERPDDKADIHRILVEPFVVDAVEAIFGQPSKVYYGMLALVPAHGGNGLPWHQDNQYSHVLPQALNTFVALCDITPTRPFSGALPERTGWAPSLPSTLSSTERATGRPRLSQQTVSRSRPFGRVMRASSTETPITAR